MSLPIRKSAFPKFLTKSETIELLTPFSRLCLDALSSHLAIVDWKGEIIFVNRSWQQFSEKNQGDFRRTGVGTNYLEVCERSAQAGYLPAQRFADGLKEVLSGSRDRFEMEYPCHSPEEKRWFLATATQLSVDKSIYAFVAHENVTTRTLLGIYLRELQEKTMQSSKMATLGELSGAVAHEINNPLSVILSRAGLLKRQMTKGCENSTQLLESCVEIENSVQRIVKLSRSLLSIVRQEAKEEFRWVSVKDLVLDVLSLSRERFMDKKIQVIQPVIPNDLKIRCRTGQISQVLLNLINNASDAVESLHERWIRIEAKERPEYIELSVTDSGKGIQKDQRDKLARVFFTTKPPGKGTGLGLVISRRLVEEHRGTLRLDPDAPNTRFVIRLPKNPS